MDVRQELLARTKRSREAHEQAQRVLASEVVGTVEMPQLIYVREAHGSRVVDLDENEYIDLTMGMGPHVLGHSPEVVVEALRDAAPRGLQFGIHHAGQEPLARLICQAAPALEQVIFGSSGTEATLYAVRAARALTGKVKIGIFDGSYHGVHDYVLATAHHQSPRTRPTAFPRGAGIPKASSDQIVMLPYREPAALEQIRAQRDELAAVLLEPVQSSNPQRETGEWIRELRQVCSESGVLFVMDEVITGFRLAYGGGQEVFDVRPDLVTYGKIIGGGTPIGAVAGPAEQMRVFTQSRSAQREAGFDPIRPVFAGTTFGGNPLSMAAGTAQLQTLSDQREEVYPYLEAQSDRMAREINDFCESLGIPARMMNAWSMFHLHFGTEPIRSSRDIRGEHREAEHEFYLHLLYHGVIIPGLHLAFLSYAHTSEDVDQVIEAFKQSFLDIRARGLV